MACAATIQKDLSRLCPHMVIVLSITLLSLRIFHAIILICLLESRIESWHMSVTLSLSIRNNAVKSAPMSEISIERFVWSNEKANEFIKKNEL